MNDAAAAAAAAGPGLSSVVRLWQCGCPAEEEREKGSRAEQSRAKHSLVIGMRDLANDNARAIVNNNELGDVVEGLMNQKYSCATSIQSEPLKWHKNTPARFTRPAVKARSFDYEREKKGSVRGTHILTTVQGPKNLREPDGPTPTVDRLTNRQID